MRETYRWTCAALLALTLLSAGAGTGYGQSAEDVRELLREAATTYGADADRLIRIATCESTLRPWAVGDGGRSHGLAQLNDLPTGLLHHFRAVGYSDPYDAYSSAQYLARVAAGEWTREGVTLARWSCR